MIVNVGGYVFGYDENEAEKKGKTEILCFKNRRLRYCEKLIPIYENVPDEYMLKCFDYEDLTEDFEP